MIPKYVTIQHEIINHIAAKGLRAGSVLPSEKDLAKQFGVSLITIRRAMSELASCGIVDRKHGVGTFVKTDLDETADYGQIILLLATRQAIPFPIVHANISKLQTSVMARGYQLSVLSAGSKVDSLSIENLRNADGILANGWITNEWTQLLESLDIPTVFVGNIAGDQRNIPLVAYDWQKSTELIAEELISHGAQKIGILLGEKEYAPSKEMIAGLRSVLARHNRALPEKAIYYTHGKAAQTIREFLLSRPQFDGWVLEAGTCVHALANLFDAKKKPLMGVLSTHPQFTPIKNLFFESAFDGDVYEKSVEILFSLKQQEGSLSDILIQPFLCS